jgi:antitoxin component YwqK of YwqJK toxin-antitoxin module
MIGMRTQWQRWACLPTLLAVVIGCDGGETGDASSTESVVESATPTGNEGNAQNRSDSQGTNYERNSSRRETVGVQPYEGPPIFLDEPEDPVPATVVESKRTVKQNYPDGSPYIERQVTRYSDERIINDGTYREFFRNGQLFVEGRFEEGDRQGEWTYWHDNGQKNRTVTYKDGLPDGGWEIFREDGTLEARRQFKMGQRDGEWIVYNESGDEPRQLMNFKDGQPHGTWKEWYPTGAQKGVYEFRDGKRHGEASEWAEDGSERARAHYKDGKLHGEVIKWDVDGKQYVQEYEDGRLVKDVDD